MPGAMHANVVGYVRGLERTIITALATYGIEADTIEGLTGVWVRTALGDAKIAAIGVRVNTVAPGLIDTPIYGQGDASEAFKANLQKGVLFPQRLGFQEELASMVVECVTNSYMNAETIRVDGGIRMPPK
jgi:NAD(P)-dependent dehydrogenase (short-subunit alcohol dehydrogenase family)